MLFRQVCCEQYLSLLFQRDWRLCESTTVHFYWQLDSR